MNFVFEQSPWDALLEELRENETVSALQLLTLLEEADEEETELFLDSLAEKHITIEVESIPKMPAAGTAAARLRQEEQLVRQGALLQGLDQNDPLRLYLEDVAAVSAAPFSGKPETAAQKRQFTDAMLGKTVQLAQEYVGMGVLLLDLIQEANMGLWQGVQTCTDEDITNHCIWWSRHYLARAVLLQARSAGVGQKLRQAAEDYKAVDERLLTELGRNPTVEEIAEALHMSVAQTESVAEMLENAKLLRRIKNPEPEVLPQEEDQAVENTAYFQMRQRIGELLSVLSEEDAKLLTLRYGLEGGIPMKPEQVAQTLGITMQDVVAREAAALSKLRTKNE